MVTKYVSFILEDGHERERLRYYKTYDVKNA